MIGVILARIFFVALIIIVGSYIVSKFYSIYIKEQMTDEEVEDIIGHAQHDRVIKEAKKVADKIKNDELEESNEVKSKL